MTNSGTADHFLIIIGAMKCGTTTLYNQLAEHPQVCGCARKEPNFFSHDDVHRRGPKWYRSLWDFDATRHKVALEASTNYSKHQSFPDTTERIASVDAEFKFVYLVRDPIDRIESHYTHGLATQWGSGASIDEGVHLDDHLLDVSRYASQLGRYRDRFGRDAIFIVRFDDLKTRPDEVIRDVLKFAGIDPAGFELSESRIDNTNHNRVVNDPVWRRLRKIRPLRRVAAHVPAGAKSAVHGLMGRRVTDNVRLSSRQRDRVRLQLRDDLIALRRDYDVDVSHWATASTLPTRGPIA